MSNSRKKNDGSPMVKPIEQVHEVEAAINRDPLFYHPNHHPKYAALFKQKSADLDKLNSVAEPLTKDDLTPTAPTSSP